MIEYDLMVRWLHVIGAAVLLETGSGIAFFMELAHQTRDARLIAHTASIVVVADYLFTATAVVVQPVTGVLLACEIGWALSEGWVALSLGMYGLVGLLWLPVVWMQHRMRTLASEAARSDSALPRSYDLMFRTWIAFGGPAFVMALAILWLMLARPAIELS